MVLHQRLNPPGLVWSEISWDGDCKPEDPEPLLLFEKLDPLDLLPLLLPELLPLKLSLNEFTLLALCDMGPLRSLCVQTPSAR